MSECVVLMERENPMPGREEMSKMATSRSSSIRGEGNKRRQLLDIWDGSGRVQPYRWQGGRGDNPD